jgi:hypothetical protein
MACTNKNFCKCGMLTKPMCDAECVGDAVRRDMRFSTPTPIYKKKPSGGRSISILIAIKGFGKSMRELGMSAKEAIGVATRWGKKMEELKKQYPNGFHPFIHVPKLPM